MCGIAGMIARASDKNQAALRRMSGALSHRGPDGEGFWCGTPDSAGNTAILAHRRLSILDLSTAAAQPMIDARTGQAFVFNGEIYNFQSIRNRLIARGEHFTSTGDTEVMLRALALDGIDALPTLRGMFAFGLWDDSARQLMLGRDPLGIKPLYVCHSRDVGGDGEWSLLFASELRALLASGLIPHPRLDPAAVESIVWNGFVVAPHTIVQGISCIWPGEVRTYDCSGRENLAKTYWHIPPPGADPPATEGELAAALQESVRLHLLSDVPLGLFLSGGIDSSALANTIRKVSKAPLNTFTLSFGESELDEAPAAAAIAAAIGTQHHRIPLAEAEFVANLDAACNSLDQPSFDGINSYYISRAVRNAGLVVALVGTGGDELFGGYASFRYVPKMLTLDHRLRRVPGGMKQLAARAMKRIKAGSGAAGVGPQTRWAKLPDMVAAGDDVLGLYQLSYALFLPAFQDQLLAGGHRSLQWGLPAPMRRRLMAETSGRSPLAAVAALEQRMFLGERLLRDVDAASMAVSIETRLPLVDSVLLEQVNRADETARFQPVGRKAMLRRIGLRGLDPALFDRPKRGFVLPLERWIQQGLRGPIDATLRDPQACSRVGLNPQAVACLWDGFASGATGLYWSRIWSIYMLMRWSQTHGVAA